MFSFYSAPNDVYFAVCVSPVVQSSSPVQWLYPPIWMVVSSSDHPSSMHSCCIEGCSSETALIATVISLWLVGVSIDWTGLQEWTTGLDYWTHPNCYKTPFKCRTKAKRVHSACYFANVGSLSGRGVFPNISRGQRSCAYLISFNNWRKPSHIWSRNTISVLCASKQRLEFGFCIK